jgi:glycosyltransferase involved in cell wall biosynthesis
MPTYNHEEFLPEAIEGVLAQITDFPVELIIGEDASADRTLAIATAYQKRRPDVIRVLYAPRNVGMVLNIRRLIERARGGYIAFCEGDDYWLPGAGLAKRIALIESSPNLGVVHSNYAITRRVLGKWRRFPSHRTLGINQTPVSGKVFSTVFTQLPNLTCTTLYRRAVLTEWLDAEISRIDDRLVDLCLSALCASKWSFAYLDEVTAVYRISRNSATRSGRSGRLQFELNRLDIYSRFQERFGDRSDFDHEFRVLVHSEICDAAFWAGHKVLFRKYANLADPTRIHRYAFKDFIARLPFLNYTTAIWEKVNRLRTEAASMASVFHTGK